MISVFLREHQPYSLEELGVCLQAKEMEMVRILRRLKSWGIVKVVKKGQKDKDFVDRDNQEEVLCDVEPGDQSVAYKFVFVGVMTIAGRVLKCYPKYITDNPAPVSALKQALKVMEKMGYAQIDVGMHSQDRPKEGFYLLSLILFLLQDYFDYGLYTTTHIAMETNGPGSILWDRTVNETFTLIQNNRPYYPELRTVRRIENQDNLARRIHQVVLSQCTQQLRQADLLDLFDLAQPPLWDETWEDLGDPSYLLYVLEQELASQFNTRNQLLLQGLHAYITRRNTLDNVDGFSLLGTTSFHYVWETVCAQVVDSQLKVPLNTLPLPLAPDYVPLGEKTLLDLVEKPCWQGQTSQGASFQKIANKTLEPDAISLVQVGGHWQFVITDAKYYFLQLEPGKPLASQPGIESITKQYLYQLAYGPFVKAHGIDTVYNCFLLPTQKAEIVVAGAVSLQMLQALNLADIQVRLLPAEKMFTLYLEGRKLPLAQLALGQKPPLA